MKPVYRLNGKKWPSNVFSRLGMQFTPVLKKVVGGRTTRSVRCFFVLENWAYELEMVNK